MNNYRADLQKAYKKKVVEKLDKVVRAAGLIFHGQVKNLTPIDTGRAQSNWFLDINAPRSAEVEAGFDNESDAAVNAAAYKSGDTIIISNNLPYIRRLDEGYSQQAPQGMVDGALQITKRKIKEFAGTL